ncbi:MAG: YncE family protein [Gemmatimonadaceae bacterium]|nr:YncE family protein [Gemmatimonadaceae bacterium]
MTRMRWPLLSQTLLASAAAAGLIALTPEHSTAQRARSTPPAVSRPKELPPAPPGSSAPTADYFAYVGAESADMIYRIRFGPDGAHVEKAIPIGIEATEMEGPHGLQISPDGKWLFMTTGHGTPDGKFWKYALGPDTLVGPPTVLGYFPASIDVTPDGLYTFSANFNLHGEMVPSSISVVYTPTNTEVAQTTTCVMPHGSRFNHAGTRHYSGCMMDDMLVELDTRTYEVSAMFSLAKGKEGLVKAPEHAGHAMAATDNREGHGASMTATCSPTWAQPAATGSLVYVACNKADQILEVDAASWRVVRRFQTGVGPYNLAVTPDGKFLLATLKKGAGFEMIDLATGQSVYRDKLSTTIGHGVAVSPDSRYAFVSSEGVGAAPGKVDVFDLVAKQRVGTVDVGQQASGIAFWKMVPRP